MKKLCLLGVVMAFLFLGCNRESESDQPMPAKKTDAAVVDRFFNATVSPLKSGNVSERDVFYDEVIAGIKLYNDTSDFVGDFVQRYGYPDWQNGWWYKTTDGTVLQVPVYKDGANEVEALIVAVEKDGVLCGYLLVRDHFDAFLNNQAPQLTLNKVVDYFILADFSVFGASNYLPGGRAGYLAADQPLNGLKAAGASRCYYMEVYVGGKLYSARVECEEILPESAAGEPDGGSSTGGFGNLGTPGGLGGPVDSNPSGGGSNTAPESAPPVADDPSFINTEAECIRDRLFNTGEASILNKLIGSFELDASRVNLTYKIDDIPVNGRCGIRLPNNMSPEDYNGPLLMEIIIDVDRLTSNPIELARTILHEAFHAHMYAKIWDTPGIREELLTDEEIEFSSLWEMYDNAFGDQPDANSSQHNYMANEYRDYIVQGLLQFTQGTNWESQFLNHVKDVDGWIDLETYLYTLSWGGLKGTDVFTNFKTTTEYEAYLFQRQMFDYLRPILECSEL